MTPSRAATPIVVVERIAFGIPSRADV